MDGLTLIEFIASQGPAFLMTVIFAWLFFKERQENAALHQMIISILAQVAKLKIPQQPGEIPTVETMDLPF